jgi:hypothetical protein
METNRITTAHPFRALVIAAWRPNRALIATSARTRSVSGQDLGAGLLLPSTKGLGSGVSGFMEAEAKLKVTLSGILQT